MKTRKITLFLYYKNTGIQMNKIQRHFAAFAVSTAAILPGIAAASTYHLITPIAKAGVTPGQGGSTNPPVNISVALAAGVLPAALVNKPYSHSLASLLSVAGDPGYTSDQSSWQQGSTGLPSGLVLSSTGEITGTPTEANEVGKDFTVQASYKGKTGQQSYRIVVHGVELEVRSLAAGNFHTCAVTVSGGVKCWGYNPNGQLGNNSTVDSWVPVDVVGLSEGVSSISASSGHTCAVTNSGQAKCWGANGKGELGNNTLISSSVPVDVVGLGSTISQISAGVEFTCALTVNGGVKCWGSNYIGQLGNNSTIDSATPVNVHSLNSGISKIYSRGQSSCVITSSGAVLCWGTQSNGLLGNNITTGYSPVPANVDGLSSGVTSIAVGPVMACAVVPDGVKCWGSNTLGSLGHGVSGGISAVPVSVHGLGAGVLSLSVAQFTGCAVTAAGAAMCWGGNNFNQLGDGGVVASSTTPVAVAGLSSGVLYVTSGHSHTCAKLSSGGLKCWGRNQYGQLGNNSDSNAPSPVDVQGSGT